jgi:hypothetical protein
MSQHISGDEEPRKVLDANESAAADDAWRATVHRRIDEVRSGSVELVDGTQMIADARARAGGRLRK